MNHGTILQPIGLMVLLILSATMTVTAAPGRSKDPHLPAELTFSADKEAYVQDETALLTWESSQTKFCSASGEWSGKLPTSGSYRTPALVSSGSYRLKCNAPGGGVEKTLLLSVTVPTPPPEEEPAPPPEEEPPPPEEPAPGEEPAPAPDPVYEPVLTLAADRAVADSGGAVTLTWSAEHATGCQAEGGWFGAKGTSGSESVGPLYSRTTYSLTCTGDGGSVLVTVDVLVLGTVTLDWVAPVENVDGSPLTDLFGFRIYVGEASRSYEDVVEVMDPESTSRELQLASGTYYVAMTALDSDGNESAYSNEVQKQLP